MRPLTKSRHLTCVSGNYLSPGPSGRRRGNYSSELSGQSELPFGRRQTLQRAGGLPRRSSPGPAGPLTCRRRKIGATTPCPVAAGSVFSGKVQNMSEQDEMRLGEELHNMIMSFNPPARRTLAEAFTRRPNRYLQESQEKTSGTPSPSSIPRPSTRSLIPEAMPTSLVDCSPSSARTKTSSSISSWRMKSPTSTSGT